MICGLESGGAWTNVWFLSQYCSGSPARSIVVASSIHAVRWPLDGLHLLLHGAFSQRRVCLHMHHGPGVTERCSPGDQ